MIMANMWLFSPLQMEHFHFTVALTKDAARVLPEQTTRCYASLSSGGRHA